MTGFDEIAAYYHLLFPARPAQLGFLSALAGPPPGPLVDVGCGVGEYTAALCAQGYSCTGLELDLAMLEAAIARHGQSQPPRFIQGDMLELTDLVRGPCALVFCIGNTLPHLAGDRAVAEALHQMWDLTRPAGTVAVQVVNFDRVAAQAQADAPPGVDLPGERVHFTMPPLRATLPEGGEIELARGYDLTPWPAQVIFRTALSTAALRSPRESRLLALTRERLERLLPSGAAAEWFGDFDRRPWSAAAPATILTLR